MLELHANGRNRNVGTCCAKSLTGFKLYATSANIVVVPCKRTQQVTTLIVGSNNVACCWPTMLRPFAWALLLANNVASVCMGLKNVRLNKKVTSGSCHPTDHNVLRPVQMDATLLANNTQHCWAQHVASVCMEPQQYWHLLALVAYSLKPVKRLVPCKRTQHCWPRARNNVVTCCELLRPFAWAFMSNCWP